MKLRKLGQVVLAAVVGIGCSFGITSCVQSHTVGYLFVTGAQYNQVATYKITNNTGNLTAPVAPISSGGVNPVDAVVAQAGKFLYVLNAGCADPAVYPDAKYKCASGVSPTRSSVELFSIGGDGVLTAEQNYLSQGENSVAISLDSTGNYLYVLDQNTPSGPGSFTPSQYANDGDVSVYQINPNTGRLSIQQNLQLQNTNGEQMYVFPVGVGPVWFKLFNSNLFTIDRNNGALANPSWVNVYSASTGGQLLVTQNSEFPITGAANLVYVTSGGSYLYLLDAGNAANPSGAIYIYTAGTNGALASVVGGAETQAALGYPTVVGPTVMTTVGTGSTNTFVYVANTGLNTSSQVEPASNISAYDVVSGGTTVLQPIAGAGSAGTVTTGANAGPRCILEDPSNQYLFVANHDTNSIVGYIINTEAGALTGQRGKGTLVDSSTSSNLVPGEPTWCVASGSVF
jgi:6-phosphogluconolactonase (cycloisomerase 2 family)